jgi:flagellar basal-body rod protein FlgB
MNRILDPTIGALNTALNLRLMNQNVISSNIANADTPGYKAKSVEFEQALRDNLGIGNELSMTVEENGHQAPKDVDPVNPIVYESNNGVQSLDGNTVDMGEEMAKQAENQLLYNASVELMRKKLGMLRYGITEGGGSR